MALDPALQAHQGTIALPRLADLRIREGQVYAFDFDGVIASRFEDDIYKLAPFEEERPLIEAVAQAFRIPCAGMHLPYQRHLVYQAAAWKLSLPIAEGPGIRAAIEASQNAKLFILTARSGWYAVERLRRFVLERGLTTVETYHVGRVSKDRQIELLSREFPRLQVTYVDDSAAQLDGLSRLQLANVSLVYADSDEPVASEDERRRTVISTLEKALLA